jgi:hypothetical protein
VDEDHYLEQALSFYKAKGGLAPTPGHAAKGTGVRYRTFAPDAAILRCFQCHSTGPLSLAPGRAVQPAEPGVRCESCHGPGSAHIAKPAASNIVNPGKLTPDGQNTLCGECHRMPPAKGVETNWNNPWNTRHQPVYLSQSRCFTSGKLSCRTCHEPHTDQLADVSAQCRTCHAAPKHETPVAGRTCDSCHMPAVAPGPYLSFRNHWIGIYDANSPLRPRSKASNASLIGRPPP